MTGRQGRHERLRSVHGCLLDRSAWTDPGPLQFGNAPERDGDVRGFRQLQRGHQHLQGVPGGRPETIRFELQLGNLFDRIVYCTPNQNWSSQVSAGFSRSATRPGRCSWASGSTSSRRCPFLPGRAVALPGGAGILHTLQPTSSNSPRERRRRPSLACGPPFCHNGPSRSCVDRDGTAGSSPRG